MTPLRRLHCLVFVATGISAILPASADQAMLQCNLARYELETIVRFDNHATARGLTICGTPQMSARYKVQQYCGTRTHPVTASSNREAQSDKSVAFLDDFD